MIYGCHLSDGLIWGITEIVVEQIYDLMIGAKWMAIVYIKLSLNFDFEPSHTSCR